jgi:hypothetical protein
MGDSPADLHCNPVVQCKCNARLLLAAQLLDFCLTITLRILIKVVALSALSLVKKTLPTSKSQSASCGHDHSTSGAIRTLRAKAQDKNHSSQVSQGVGWQTLSAKPKMADIVSHFPQGSRPCTRSNAKA